MNHICGFCEKHNVVYDWNKITQRFEPFSKYWKGPNMEEVYCSAMCSLLKHKKVKHERISSDNSKKRA